MSVEHDYFGYLGEEDGDLHWSESVEVGDQDVAVEVTAADATLVGDEWLDVAAAMIGSLDQLEARARESLVTDLPSTNSAVSVYITRSEEELGDEILADNIAWDSGDTQIDFLRSLRLMRAAFFPANSGTDEQFGRLEFAIAPDDSENVLVAFFDAGGDVVSVELGE